MRSQIIVVGSLNMDLVTRTAHIPQPGETILGSDLQYYPGGKGANQAVATARAGGKVTMIGRVGDDAFAQPLLDNLTEASVDSTLVHRTEGSATGVALIVVDDHGENSIVVASGANMKLTPQDVEAAEETIAASGYLLLQLESPLETVQRAAEIARQHDVLVILNPAPAPVQPLPSSLLKHVNILIPNETETALLTNMPVESIEQTHTAINALSQLGVETVIVTLGERGALLAQTGEFIQIPAFKVNPVDTTAAGDAFVGGLAVALAEGQPLADAVQRANASGALATTLAGAQPSLPTWAQVDALLNKTKA